MEQRSLFGLSEHLERLSKTGDPLELTRDPKLPPNFGRVRQNQETDGMKRSRFTEEQIIGILKEQEAGAKTADVCRKHGISDAAFYKYKAKHGGMEVSDARKLKALEDENTKLKKLLAETMLDNAILKDVASKNGDAPLGGAPLACRQWM
jgi:putative transposase